MFVRWKKLSFAPGRPPRSPADLARFPFDLCPHQPSSAPRWLLRPVVKERLPGKERRQRVIWAPPVGIPPCCAADPSWPLARVAFWRRCWEQKARLSSSPHGPAILAAWPLVEAALIAVAPVPDDLDFRVADLWRATPARSDDLPASLRAAHAALRLQALAAVAREQAAAQAAREAAQAAREAATREAAAREAAAREAAQAREQAAQARVPRTDPPPRGDEWRAEATRQLEKLRCAPDSRRAQIEAAVGLLGLPLPFPPGELKRAFRDAARRHHPDRGGTDAMMIQIIAAHRLLTAFLG